MKRNFIASLLIVLLSLTSFAQNYCGGTVKGGDGRPWPWGLETKFNWKSLQGIWEATTIDCTNQFIFKVSDTVNGKIIKITQYDPNSCKVVGFGTGLLNGKVITAQMNKKGIAYNLTLHVFNETDVQDIQNHAFSPNKSQFASANRYVVVINLFPVGNWEERTTYQIVKVDTATNMICQ